MKKKNLNILFATVVAASYFTGCAAGNAGSTAGTDATSVNSENTTSADSTTSADVTSKENTENTSEAAPVASDSEKIKVVTTIFPEYDWVKEVLGDEAANAEITMLLDNGVDLHSYQPTADDVIKIASSDLFIYVGGESDGWVEDALSNSTNPDMQVINLLDVLGDSVKAEEIVEGMEHNHDHDHGHEEHAEIEESDIQDRSLAEFAGEWSSILPFLENGELDEYVEHHAQEHGEPAEEVKEELAAKWACDATDITITDNNIAFTFADGTNCSAEYEYAGFTPVRGEDGDITGVRYQFKTEDPSAPDYVQLNDHGYQVADEVAHFHIYYGDESFEALNDFGSNPFFAPASMTGAEVAEALAGHNHNHEEEHEHEEGEEHEHEHESDEHVWLSLKSTQVLVSAIADSLGVVDSANADTYQTNAAAYNEKLSALDAEYAAAVDAAAVKTVLFGDRFPFRYMVDDYGLSYYAAFAGCSAETEASFETIVFLADKVNELGLNSVLTIESSDGKIADTIIQSTNDKDQKVLVLDSMQSTTSEDVAAGATYLSIMENNLEVLKEALK